MAHSSAEALVGAIVTVLDMKHHCEEFPRSCFGTSLPQEKTLRCIL